MIAFDNLSKLPAELADAMCCIATGAGLAARARYSDDDERRIKVLRPQMINGIAAVTTREDLLSRSISITPPPFPGVRKTEWELEEEFKKVQPQILGAIYDAISVGLRSLPQLREEKHVLPRMTDFAEWILACEPGLWEPGRFMELYGQNQDAAAALVIEDSLWGSKLLEFVHKEKRWEGTATDLHKVINTCSTSRDSLWPETPRAASARLNRIETSLEANGIRVTRLNNHHPKHILLENAS